METVNTPLRFSTSEVPEETTIRESEEPEEQDIPAPLELSVNLISEDLSAQFISAVDEIPVNLPAKTKACRRKSRRKKSNSREHSVALIDEEPEEPVIPASLPLSDHSQRRSFLINSAL